jgi:hypothetical protein
MATLVLERSTLPDPLSSYFVAPRIAMIPQRDGDVMLSPIIDPADYDNDNDYLNAIPGMRESIMEASASPMSDDVDVPSDWIKRRV